MKKINSIWFGGKLIGIGILFSAVIPLILAGISKLFKFNKVLIPVIKLSIILGVIVLLFFSIILFIELRQDKKLDAYYNNNRSKKLLLPDKSFECQNCENLKVREKDTECSICGIKFI